MLLLIMLFCLAIFIIMLILGVFMISVVGWALIFPFNVLFSAGIEYTWQSGLSAIIFLSICMAILKQLR